MHVLPRMWLGKNNSTEDVSTFMREIVMLETLHFYYTFEGRIIFMFEGVYKLLGCT